MAYLMLAVSIAFELVATSFLKMSEGFTKLGYSLGCIVCYCISFYVVSKVLNYIPLNVTYATWSGLGLVITAIISAYIFHESLNIYSIIGIALIVIGVVVLNLLGNTGH